MKAKFVFRAAGTVLLFGLIALVQGPVVLAGEGGEGEDVRNSNPDVVFGPTLPSSIFRTITAPSAGADVDISAKDCCIRDDVVEIYVDGCLLATIDSRNGEFGTHPGETHTVSVGPGLHSVEYRNVISSVGPSGWEVSETLNLIHPSNTPQG